MLHIIFVLIFPLKFSGISFGVLTTLIDDIECLASVFIVYSA